MRGCATVPWTEAAHSHTSYRSHFICCILLKCAEQRQDWGSWRQWFSAWTSRTSAATLVRDLQWKQCAGTISEFRIFSPLCVSCSNTELYFGSGRYYGDNTMHRVCVLLVPVMQAQMPISDKYIWQEGGVKTMLLTHHRTFITKYILIRVKTHHYAGLWEFNLSRLGPGNCSEIEQSLITAAHTLIAKRTWNSSTQSSVRVMCSPTK